METGLQRDAGKVPQSGCDQQIFRQMRGLSRSECLSCWTDCLNRAYTCTKHEFNLDLPFSSFSFQNFKLHIFPFGNRNEGNK